MKLFLYSDVHISRTSSILPTVSENEKYTYRQNMIIKTAEWMSEIIKQENADMIINLGDTFDQNTITSYDVETASEFFKRFPSGIRHLVLCGNHEMLNSKDNVLKLLNNIECISVIDTVTSIDNLLLIPYCDYKDLDLTPYNEADYLFLHHDIYGSQIAPGRALDFGIEQGSLSKFKRVFNGHVHASSKFGNIVNVGSITTHSFADSPISYPTCYIFDTVTGELKEFYNRNCPLFRKIKADTIQELQNYLAVNLEQGWNYILHIDCSFEIKSSVEDIIKNRPNVLNYKITTKSIKQDGVPELENTKIESNLDVKKSFKDFLNTGIELRYPMNLYNEVIGEIKDKEENVKADDKIEILSSNKANSLF